MPDDERALDPGHGRAGSDEAAAAHKAREALASEGASVPPAAPEGVSGSAAGSSGAPAGDSNGPGGAPAGGDPVKAGEALF
ncbi:MAG: hypothetical protein LBQ79_13465, partial [Deltaproteobacteria bacterium]|nr:hypothetical protein [Deltaproteobacteria bacterium]